MPISVGCPKCGQKLKARDEQAGRQATCPSCGSLVAVPPTVLPPEAGPTGVDHGGFPGIDVAAAGRTSGPPAGTETLRERQGTLTGTAPPPPLPGGAGLAGSIELVMQGVTQAFCVKKIGFFLLASLCVAIVFALMSGLGVLLASQTQSAEPVAFMLLLGLLFLIGSSGVIAGGVAYMTNEESDGRSSSFSGTLVYCGRHFLPFFGGALLLAVGLLLAGGMLNGLIIGLNTSKTVGSFLAALLFLPQFVINAALVIVLLLGVIVFSAMVVERIGPIRGISRLVTLVAKQTGSLATFYSITLLLVGMLTVSILWIGLAAATPTILTNGPSFESIFSGMTDGIRASGGPMEKSQPDLFGPPPEIEFAMPKEARKPSGDWLRRFCINLLVAALMAFPAVCWITAFTRYYQSVRDKLEPAAALPPALPPVVPPVVPRGGPGTG